MAVAGETPIRSPRAAGGERQRGGAGAAEFCRLPGGAPFAGRNAAPVLATPDARRFRTMIRDGARRKPNFNGRYIVATWGCGTDCEMGAIVDAVTGRVVSLPVVAGSPEDADRDSTHFDFRLDSRLLVMHGMIGEEPPMGSHYFTFDGRKLTRLTTIVKPEKRWGAPPSGKPQ
jgi:hypothetical protein